MTIEHDFLVAFSKTFGLFYLIALSIGVVIYAYWPRNKARSYTPCSAHLFKEVKMLLIS